MVTYNPKYYYSSSKVMVTHLPKDYHPAFKEWSPTTSSKNTHDPKLIRSYKTLRNSNQTESLTLAQPSLRLCYFPYNALCQDISSQLSIKPAVCSVNKNCTMNNIETRLPEIPPNHTLLKTRFNLLHENCIMFRKLKVNQ